MTDKTDMSKEREAAEKWLRDRYGAYRGHFAWRELEEAFLAGRASLSANAGEPVAHLWQHCETGRTRIVMPDMIVDADASWQVVGPLYLGAAPPTAQAEGWTKTEPLIARSRGEWHEDDGPVVWWAWNGRGWAGEAPWCGTPLDSDWPGYHTHWTPAPPQPTSSADSRKGE